MAEILLANGAVIVEPKTFRVTLTLPADLKSFIETRAKQTKYASLRAEANKSAYLRDLIINDRETLGAPKRKKRKGARAR